MARNPRLTIVMLCVSFLGWHFSKSSAQPLPPGCASRELRDPVLCGCFGYRKELEDPKWRLLRKECSESLSGNIDNGEKFCNSTFLDNGVIQRNELFSYFNYTLFNCATRLYDIDIIDEGPYPTYGPSPKFTELSHGHRRTNHDQYFRRYAEVPSYQAATVRMSFYTSSKNKLKNYCLTYGTYKRFKPKRARNLCCRDA